MEDGLRELDKRDSSPARALSLLPLGFPPPPRDAGVAGDGTSIRTPTSPRVGASVTFSDTVQVKGAKGNTRKEKDKKKDDRHTVRFGFIPREELWERS